MIVMRVALMIEGQEGVDWPTWERLARLCEDHGFEALFRSDHTLSMFEPYERGSMDAWSTICAIGAITSRARLGTLVSPIGFRHPAHLARVVASADQITGGRVEVGIGAGWYGLEHSSFGFRFDDDKDRFSVLEDYMEVVHLLLTARQPVNFAGAHFRLNRATLMPGPQQTPRPPIVMGGLAGPRSAALAAKFADEYNFYDATPETVVKRRHTLDAACRAVGRRPDSLRISINGNVLIGRDHAELMSRATRHARYQALGTVAEEYVASLHPSRLVGTPDQILHRLSTYAGVGVDRVMMQVFPHDDFEAIALIGESIVERAAELEAAR